MSRAHRIKSRTVRRAPYLAALLVVATPALSQVAVFGPGGPPMPPQRPAKLTPDVAIAPRALTAPVAAPREIVTAGEDYTPVTLPAAPRARMHECGLEWQRMKSTGAAAHVTWREFARGCLTR